MKRAFVFIAAVSLLACAASAVTVEADVNYFYTFTDKATFKPNYESSQEYGSDGNWYYYQDAIDNWAYYPYPSFDSALSDTEEEELVVSGENVGVETVASIFFAHPYSWLEVGLGLGASVSWYSQVSMTDNNRRFWYITDGSDGRLVVDNTGMEWSALIGPAVRFRTLENQYLYFSPSVRSTWIMQFSSGRSLYYGSDARLWTYTALWNLGLNFNVGYRLFFLSDDKSQFGLDVGANFDVRLAGSATTYLQQRILVSSGDYETISRKHGVTGGFTGNVYAGVCVNFGK